MRRRKRYRRRALPKNARIFFSSRELQEWCVVLTKLYLDACDSECYPGVREGIHEALKYVRTKYQEVVRRHVGN